MSIEDGEAKLLEVKEAADISASPIGEEEVRRHTRGTDGRQAQTVTRERTGWQTRLVRAAAALDRKRERERRAARGDAVRNHVQKMLLELQRQLAAGTL